MLSLLLFSLIVGVVASILLVPFLTVLYKKENQRVLSFNRWLAIAILTIISTMGIFVFYYVTNLDQNWTSLWMLFLLVSILGVVAARGIERTIKMVVALGAILVGAYILSAPLFNANTKLLKWINK